MALQALRDGRARVCVATDVAARGIDLPNLDLVIHADIPNDPEVMQHRSGRTGRAGRKGVSIILVPPARKRRAEVLLNLAGIDTVWGTAPQPDEIRKLDQERMLKDALFSEETTPEDLALAQALLAERSAEDIAAALARLYRARLPSPEDILDPGQGSGRSREDRGREREGRPPRGDDRSTGPRSKKGKSSPRHAMGEGSVWFSASIGSRKNAEARWLLPMICRRGGIDKSDIGAIRIMDTTTEFEISARAAESFAVKIRRPDKEDNIRIEALDDAPPRLARALAERNFDRLTQVQTAVLADDAAGRDLLVSAQTGSGKTVAYGLAIANNLLDGAERFERAAAPLALIVAPTRELALQVHRELAWLYQHADARVVSCVGGMDPRREQRELAAGAHIVVGTPGRLCDHLRRGRLDVSELKAIVLDEADEMLDLGFREDMEFILEATPEERRTLLFSATLPRGIVALAKEYQQSAFRVEVAGDEGGHADIEYRAIRIAAGDVEHAVVNILRFYESPSALVFCNTREAVRHLQATLLERGFSVVALSGELTQNERTHGAAGAAGWPRPRLRGDRRRGARHRPAEPRSRHPRRYSERSGSHAASLRPYRPRGPQGRQHHFGAAGAQAPRRGAAEPGRHRYGLGHGAPAG